MVGSVTQQLNQFPKLNFGGQAGGANRSQTDASSFYAGTQGSPFQFQQYGTQVPGSSGVQGPGGLTAAGGASSTQLFGGGSIPQLRGSGGGVDSSGFQSTLATIGQRPGGLNNPSLPYHSTGAVNFSA